MESDTPRTDALVDEGGMPYDADFARQLERELAAAKAELVRNADELAAAIKQRDEAQRDAQRYRWLKSKGCDWITIYRHPGGDEFFDGKADERMDERIDAARSRDEELERMLGEGGGA